MTVVVHTRSRVYGPFLDGNSALDWLRSARRTMSRDDGPFSVMELSDPTEIVGSWSGSERAPRDINGKPITVEEMDRQMNYSPPPKGWGK